MVYFFNLQIMLSWQPFKHYISREGRKVHVTPQKSSLTQSKVTTGWGQGNDLELRAVRSTAWVVAFGRPTQIRESMLMNPTSALKDSMGTSSQGRPRNGQVMGHINEIAEIFLQVTISQFVRSSPWSKYLQFWVCMFLSVNLVLKVEMLFQAQSRQRLVQVNKNWNKPQCEGPYGAEMVT